MKLAACQLTVAECRPVLVFPEKRQHVHRMYTRSPLRLLMDGMAVGLRARTEETKITELPSIANLARSRLQKSELDVLGVH